MAGPGGAVNHNPAKAVPNKRLAIGVTVILPGNSHAIHRHPHPETYVVMRGRAVLEQEKTSVELARLDVVYFPPGTPHALRNSGDEPLYLLWAHDNLT